MFVVALLPTNSSEYLARVPSQPELNVHSTGQSNRALLIQLLRSLFNIVILVYISAALFHRNFAGVSTNRGTRLVGHSQPLDGILGQAIV
jgi:hypothetical protein